MTTPLQEAVANLLRVLDECLYTNDHCGLEVDKEDEAEVAAAIDAARAALAASAPSDNPIARIEAEQRAFEEWAISHGGLPLDPVGAGGCTKYGLFPATYWNDTTEVSWRAWANKPAPK